MTVTEREPFKAPEDVTAVPAYQGLHPWAAELCEKNFQESLAHGRRRRAARVDFVAGWQEAAREFGRDDVFKPEEL